MITLNTPITEVLNDPKFRNLKPQILKAYFVLLEKAGESRTITGFSIRKLAKEWEEKSELKLTSNKDMVSQLIKEMEELKLVKVDFDKKILAVL